MTYKLFLKVIAFFLITNYSLFSQNVSKKDSLSKKEYYKPLENRIYKAENGFKTDRGGKEIDSIPESKKETKLEQVTFLSRDEELMLIIEKSKLIFNDLFSDFKRSGKIMM